MGLYSYGLYSYGLYSYGRCSYGLYSYGVYQASVGAAAGLCADRIFELPHLRRGPDRRLVRAVPGIGISDGMSVARVWACRYSK